jgi:hypothetical protein
MDDLIAFVSARLAEARQRAAAGAEALRWIQAVSRILVFAGSLPQPEVSEPVLGWLAAIWDDHPDYRPEWKP